MKNIYKILFASLLCISVQSDDSCSNKERAVETEIERLGDENLKKEGVVDYTFIMNYKSSGGEQSKIYGFRIQLSNDTSKRLKQKVALSPEEMENINRLSKKEKEEALKKWHTGLYQRMETDKELVDMLYEEHNNDSPIFYDQKPLCDPASHDCVSEGGFLTAFYIPGKNTEKDPIVVVHGGPNGNAVAMLPTAVELSQATGRSVMAYTQRGCEGSGCSFDPGVDTFEQSAKDLGKAIDATRALSKRDKVVVFGHSFGPLFVSEYLSKPEEKAKVSSAIYVGPGPVNLVGFLKTVVKRKEVYLRDKDIMATEKNPMVRSLLYSMGRVTAFSNLQMARDYAMAWFQSDQKSLLEIKTSYFQNSKNISTHNNWNLGRDSLKHMKKKSLKNRFKNIKQPVLIIHGADDSIPQSNAKTLCKNMANARCVILENTAHCPFDENPNGFYPLVTDFLDQLDGAQDIGTQNTDNQNVKKD